MVMNDYALTLVIKSDLAEKARQELLAAVTKKFGSPREVGKLVKEELWGNRDLAYPIKHQTKGYYAHYFFSAEPPVAPALDKALKIEEDILRYLIIRL